MIKDKIKSLKKIKTDFILELIKIILEIKN